MIKKEYLKSKHTIIKNNFNQKLLGKSFLSKSLNKNKFFLNLKFQTPLILNDRFINNNNIFVKNREYIKEKILYISNPTKLVEISKNIFVEKEIYKTPLIRYSNLVNKSIVQKNIITTDSISLLDRFTITNNILVKNQEYLKEKISYISTEPKVIEVSKDIFVEKIDTKTNILTHTDFNIEKLIKTYSIKEELLSIKDRFTITNNILVKNQEYLKDKISYISTEPKLIEISKDILTKQLDTTIKKDTLIEDNLYIKDRFIISNSILVKNREYLKERVTYINNPSQLLEISKNILVQKSIYKTNVIKEDNISISNLYITNKPVDKKAKEVSAKSSKEEYKNPILVEKSNKKDTKNFIKKIKDKQLSSSEQDSISSLFDKEDIFSLGFTKTPKIKPKEKDIDCDNTTTHITNQINQTTIIEETNITNINIETTNIFNTLLLSRTTNIETLIENKFQYFTTRLEVDMDYLATRIFNQLKDELDIEYRRL